MTGIALAWMAPTTPFGSVVKNAKMSFVVSPSFTFRMAGPAGNWIGFDARPSAVKTALAVWSRKVVALS